MQSCTSANGFGIIDIVKASFRGGGIGGLAFAISLAKYGADVDVDIYESAASFGEIGAGIGFWPRAWGALETIGLEDELQRHASPAGGEHHSCSIS